MTDNKPSFTSAQLNSFAQRCGLTLHYADPRHRNSKQTSWKGTFYINRISSMH